MTKIILRFKELFNTRIFSSVPYYVNLKEKYCYIFLSERWEALIQLNINLCFLKSI